MLVCQSAYMLSRGEDIAEQAVAEEAAALLKELQQRTKEQPDAYKKPMYVGIYQVQIELLSLMQFLIIRTCQAVPIRTAERAGCLH